MRGVFHSQLRDEHLEWGVWPWWERKVRVWRVCKYVHREIETIIHGFLNT